MSELNKNTNPPSTPSVTSVPGKAFEPVGLPPIIPDGNVDKHFGINIAGGCEISNIGRGGTVLGSVPCIGPSPGTIPVVEGVDTPLRKPPPLDDVHKAYKDALGIVLVDQPSNFVQEATKYGYKPSVSDGRDGVVFAIHGFIPASIDIAGVRSVNLAPGIVASSTGMVPTSAGCVRLPADWYKMILGSYITTGEAVHLGKPDRKGDSSDIVLRRAEFYEQGAALVGNFHPHLRDQVYNTEVNRVVEIKKLNLEQALKILSQQAKVAGATLVIEEELKGGSLPSGKVWLVSKDKIQEAIQYSDAVHPKEKNARLTNIRDLINGKGSDNNREILANKYEQQEKNALEGINSKDLNAKIAIIANKSILPFSIRANIGKVINQEEAVQK
jgi:hypothetical protein